MIVVCRIWVFVVIGLHGLIGVTTGSSFLNGWTVVFVLQHSTSFFHIFGSAPDYIFSNHRPLACHFGAHPVGGPLGGSSILRFEEAWLSHEECKSVVAHNWNSISAVGLPEGLARNTRVCMKALSQWGHSKVGNYARHIWEASARVQATIQNTSLGGSRAVILDAESALESLLLEEEVYWKQRSRECSLKWGDKNMKWFHNRASLHQRVNSIVGLEDSSGCWEQDPDEIRADEVVQALKQIQPSKALGLDGLTGSFCMNFCEVIGADFVRSYLQVLNDNASPRALTPTLITLISMTKQPCWISDYRPFLCVMSVIN